MHFSDSPEALAMAQDIYIARRVHRPTEDALPVAREALRDAHVFLIAAEESESIRQEVIASQAAAAEDKAQLSEEKQQLYHSARREWLERMIKGNERGAQELARKHSHLGAFPR